MRFDLASMTKHMTESNIAFPSPGNLQEREGQGSKTSHLRGEATVDPFLRFLHRERMGHSVPGQWLKQYWVHERVTARVAHQVDQSRCLP
jgi:hypothetical protein